MDLKVIEPIKNYLKEFKTVDEFNLYYSKNKDEIDSMTTHKLNKMYHIDGYRITKIKGKLCLKKWEKKDKESNNENDHLEFYEEDVILSLRKEINYLKNEIEKLKITINSIINVINSSSNE